jgi:phosphoglycolate phosphatase
VNVGSARIADAFIFDLDGTLVRFDVDWADVRARIGTLLTMDEVLSPLIPAIERLAPDDETRRRIYTLIDDAEIAAAAKLRPDPETSAVLERLRAVGVSIALVTLQGRRAATDALERTGLAAFFETIVTRDEALVRRDQISAAVRALSVPPGRAIVVADRAADMSAAKEAGCIAVSVGERPGVMGDYHARRVGELLSVLGWEAS